MVLGLAVAMVVLIMPRIFTRNRPSRFRWARAFTELRRPSFPLRRKAGSEWNFSSFFPAISSPASSSRRAARTRTSLPFMQGAFFDLSGLLAHAAGACLHFSARAQFLSGGDPFPRKREQLVRCRGPLLSALVALCRGTFLSDLAIRRPHLPTPDTVRCLYRHLYRGPGSARLLAWKMGAPFFDKAWYFSGFRFEGLAYGAILALIAPQMSARQKKIFGSLAMAIGVCIFAAAVPLGVLHSPHRSSRPSCTLQPALRSLRYCSSAWFASLWVSMRNKPECSQTRRLCFWANSATASISYIKWSSGLGPLVRHSPDWQFRLAPVCLFCVSPCHLLYHQHADRAAFAQFRRAPHSLAETLLPRQSQTEAC